MLVLRVLPTHLLHDSGIVARFTLAVPSTGSLRDAVDRLPIAFLSAHPVNHTRIVTVRPLVFRQPLDQRTNWQTHCFADDNCFAGSEHWQHIEEALQIIRSGPSDMPTIE